MSMKTADEHRKPWAHWGIYRQDREYAREMGDPCLGIVEATSKSEAEAEARRQGLSGPTGQRRHPLQRGSK